ncbi:MAG: hypothetical protein WKG32_04890 [Gemmatimonadaceae bacterium]
MPLLLLGVADYVEDPARAIGTDAPVIAKAMEFGALRHAQGFGKFVKPLYAAMAESEWGAREARRIYRLARPLYHAAAWASRASPYSP